MKLVHLFLIGLPIIYAAVPNPRPEDNDVYGSIDGRSGDDQPGWKTFNKIINDCGSEDTVNVLSCLGVKAVTVMNRAARMGDVELIQGISMVRSNDYDDVTRNGRAMLTESEVENSLALQQPADRTSRLLDMMYDSALRFLQSHTLQFKFPQMAPETLQRALEEGRGKLKKKLLPILLLVGLKFFAIIPVVLGVIGLLAAKALIIGKLALIVTGIIALQKFISGGGGNGYGLGGFGKFPDGWTNGGSSSGWTTGGSSSGGYTYGRSASDLDPHKLAYSAQIPSSDASNVAEVTTNVN